MIYFKIFPNCKIVSGKKNAIIHDLERNTSELIPLEFAQILNELDKKIPLDILNSRYTDDEQKIIEVNLQHIVDKEYGIFCSEELFSCFPEMSLEFQEASEITNSIIELKYSTIFNLNNYLIQLEELGCFDVSIVFYEPLTEKNFIDLFNQIPQNRIKSVEILSKWHEDLNDSLFSRINEFCPQIVRLSFFAAPFEKLETWDRDKNILFERQFVTANIINFTHCGKVEPKYFNTNIYKVLESINHNSCLHKKITIDTHGNIKNCPAIHQNFGNIKTNSLREVLNTSDFKKYWNLTKDNIEVCKDCEFRYICTDCRAYTERTHFSEEGLDISKPLKCGYNPYIGEWEDWSTNPLKQKVMQYYKIK
ncbi:grasp-with-spasm system SPASM domain peptide maturase [Chryseobacterium gregarium]|uniref:grasp-with-spasm system SPASM domain peptide maturase n=1 Tax=Chryseobacterium gregarium TaxID=456299 RepID=UPI00041ABC58|nr:grasp-with-spasm system SPASM domain peptide maturase [Chryseobacterium gregarium]